MGVLAEVKNATRDLRKAGAGFAVDGLRGRFAGKLARLRLPGGGFAFYRPKDTDLATFRQIFRERQYALDAKWARKRVKARYDALVAAGLTPVIVDCGANVGAASLWFKQQYPKAVIVAIEPEPSNAELLRKNLEAWPESVVFEAAIGSEPGNVEVVTNHRGSWGVTTERGSGEGGTPVVTVPQAVEAVANGRLFLVKIDIEGFESDLFASNTDWIDDAFAVYVEPHDWKLPNKGSSRGFQSEFGRRDFEIYLKGENLIYVKPGDGSLEAAPVAQAAE